MIKEFLEFRKFFLKNTFESADKVSVKEIVLSEKAFRAALKVILLEFRPQQRPHITSHENKEFVFFGTKFINGDYREPTVQEELDKGITLWQV